MNIKGNPLDRTPLMLILSQDCRSQFSTFTCDLGIKSHLKNPENSFLCMSEARAPYYMNTPNFHVALFPAHWGFSSARSARASRRARTKIWNSQKLSKNSLYTYLDHSVWIKTHTSAFQWTLMIFGKFLFWLIFRWNIYISTKYRYGSKQKFSPPGVAALCPSLKIQPKVLK